MSAAASLPGVPALPRERTARWVRVALALVALATFARALAWTWALPPWQGPDEEVHYAFVERLANGSLPYGQHSQLSTAEIVGLTADRSIPFRLRQPDRPFTPFTKAIYGPDQPDQSQAGTGAGGATSYPPGYYLAMVPFYRFPGLHTATQRLYAVRLGSALLSVLLTILTFRAVREITRDDALAVGGALLVALPPMLTQSAATCNPDIFLTVGVAGLAGACLRLHRRGYRSSGALLAVALWFVVTSLAKPIGPPFALVVVGAFLGLPALYGASRRTLAIAAALLVLAVLALVPLAAVAYNLNALANRSPAGIADFVFSYLWQFYLPRLPFMNDIFGSGGLSDPTPAWGVWVRTGTGWFGWLTAPMPEWAYRLAAGSVVAAAAAGIAALVRPARGVEIAARRIATRAVVVPALVAIAVFALLLNGAEIGALLTGQPRMLQGRYLLPAAPLAVLALAAALSLASRRLAYGALAALCAVWTALSLVGLDTVLRYYAT